MIVVTADVGGTKTTIRISDGDRELARERGPGAAIRPGRALAAAGQVADLIRQAMAVHRVVRAGTIVIGAAGAGNPFDAEEMRSALVQDRIADRVIVTTDVMLALEALGGGPGVVLIAGTGSIAVGRNGKSEIVRQGGLGWRMGDEGSGYWIGQEALKAVGTADDGRGPATTLTPGIMAIARATTVRELAAWSTIAEPREVAALAPAVTTAAKAGDPRASAIMEEAVEGLLGLVLKLEESFADQSSVPLGLAGGLLATDGPIRVALIRRLAEVPTFAVRPDPLDPLLGGPRLAV